MNDTADREAEGPAGVSRRAPNASRTWSPTPSNLIAGLLLLPAVVAIVLFVLYPLLKLVLDSYRLDGGLQAYVDALRDPVVRRALVVTLGYSALITFLAVAIGTGYAWALHVTRRPAVKTVLWIAVLVPFLMGVVVKNYAFTIILAKEGIVNDVLVRLHIFDAPHQLLYTKLAVVVGILYAMIPYAVFAVFAVVATIDLDLVRAAQSLGASRTRSLIDVALPLALPGVIASAAITFAISLGFYVTPIILGGAQTPFIATLISQNIFMFYDYPQAATVSVLLLVVAVVVLGVAGLVVGRERILQAVAQ